MTRYIGNTGRFFRIADSGAPRSGGPAPPGEPAPSIRSAPARSGGLFLRAARRGLSLPLGLELGDLGLLLLFFLLYIESGDEEFLIILAVLAVGFFTK
ncbi:MAG: hypothetical protein LBK23_10720 [Oscillospiraceae bacterium]|jgi:hypothetical protein|nr:hypothetical protein [Oscillospiraceae bacterium]